MARVDLSIGEEYLGDITHEVDENNARAGGGHRRKQRDGTEFGRLYVE
jgi:hypothetical protein